MDCGEYPDAEKALGLMPMQAPDAFGGDGASSGSSYPQAFLDLGEAACSSKVLKGVDRIAACAPAWIAAGQHRAEAAAMNEAGEGAQDPDAGSDRGLRRGYRRLKRLRTGAGLDGLKTAVFLYFVPLARFSSFLNWDGVKLLR